MTDLHDLQGFDQPVEHDALRTLAASVPADQAIVELGTYKAKGTCFLADGARRGHGAHVWTVDPWDLGDDFRTTTGLGPKSKHPLDYTDPEIPKIAKRQVAEAGLADQVTFMQDFSSRVGRMWPQHSDLPVGLLHIDADHRQGAVRRDFAAWEPHLARNAIVTWDDYRPNFPGVMEMVRILSHDKHLISEPILIGSLAVTTRMKR